MTLIELASKIRAGLARECDLEGVNAREVIAMKTDTDMGLHYRCTTGLYDLQHLELADKAASKKNNRQVKHDASDETTDSMGDIILVEGEPRTGKSKDDKERGKGWQLTEFNKNPQLLWAHDSGGGLGKSTAKPIGLVNSVKRGRGRVGQKALVSTSTFHEKELFGDDPWGDHTEAVFRMVKAGVLPAVSVGFLPKRVKFPKTEEERVKLKLGNHGMLITESELREISVVPIPANPNALVHNSIDVRSLRSLRADILRGMMKEGFGNESWMSEVIETFPITAEDWRDINRRSKRRTVSVPDMTPEDDLDETSTQLRLALQNSDSGQLLVELNDDGVLVAREYEGEVYEEVDDDPEEEASDDSSEEPSAAAMLSVALSQVASSNEMLADTLDEVREVLVTLRDAQKASGSPQPRGNEDHTALRAAAVLEAAIAAKQAANSEQ